MEGRRLLGVKDDDASDPTPTTKTPPSTPIRFIRLGEPIQAATDLRSFVSIDRGVSLGGEMWPVGSEFRLEKDGLKPMEEARQDLDTMLIILLDECIGEIEDHRQCARCDAFIDDYETWADEVRSKMTALGIPRARKWTNPDGSKK